MASSCWSSRAGGPGVAGSFTPRRLGTGAVPIHSSDLWTYTSRLKGVDENNNNNNNTIWGGSVLTSEEPPLHSGELKHALTQAGGPTQSQLSRPMSSGHHISMEHLLWRKHQWLNCDIHASNEICFQRDKKEERRNFSFC